MNSAPSRYEGQACHTTLQQPTPTNTYKDGWKNGRSKLQHNWKNNWIEVKVRNIHQQINELQSIKTYPKANRRDQIVLSTIRTEHTKMTHLHIINNSPPPM